MQQTGSFLLYVIGILLFLSGCSGAQSAADSPQAEAASGVAVYGEVIMPDSTAVPNAHIRTVPLTENMTANEEGEFTIKGPLRVRTSYTFIATHPDKEVYANLEGRAIVMVENSQPFWVTIMLGREDTIKMIGIEGRDLPAIRKGPVTSGG